MAVIMPYDQSTTRLTRLPCGLYVHIIFYFGLLESILSIGYSTIIHIKGLLDFQPTIEYGF